MRFNSNGITVEQQRLQLGDGYRYCLCCGRKIKRGRYGSRCKAKAEIRRNSPRIERICKIYVEMRINAKIEGMKVVR
jgi:hypothetical protein